MSEPRELQPYRDITNVAEPVEDDWRPVVTRIDPSHPSVRSFDAAESVTERYQAPPEARLDADEATPAAPESTQDAPVEPAADLRPSESDLGEIKTPEVTPESAVEVMDTRTALLTRANAVAAQGQERASALRAALTAAGIGRIGEATDDQLDTISAVLSEFEAAPLL